MAISSRYINKLHYRLAVSAVILFPLLMAACIGTGPSAYKPFPGPVMVPNMNDLAEAFDIVCRNYHLGPDDVLSINFYTDWAVAAGSYKLDALDEVEVQFLLDPAMNRRATIRPDGMITVPGIGDVQAAGRTPEDLGKKIESKLRRAQILRSDNGKESAGQFKTVTVGVTAFHQKAQKVIDSLHSFAAERKGVVTVNPDGTIDLPLINERILAAGHTVSDVERTINRVLHTGPAKQVLVSLALNAARSRKVYLLGEVNRPGGYEINQPITAVQALALAGGHKTDKADLSSVILISRDVYGKPMGRRLDFGRLFDEGDASCTILVKPYDVIYVPRAEICDLGRFMDTYRCTVSEFGWFY